MHISKQQKTKQIYDSSRLLGSNPKSNKVLDQLKQLKTIKFKPTSQLKLVTITLTKRPMQTIYIIETAQYAKHIIQLRDRCGGSPYRS